MLYTSFQYRVREGTEAIGRGLANELGGRIALDAPVAHIEQTSSAVEITTADGERYTAARAIVAIPRNRPTRDRLHAGPTPDAADAHRDQQRPRH